LVKSALLDTGCGRVVGRVEGLEAAGVVVGRVAGEVWAGEVRTAANNIRRTAQMSRVLLNCKYIVAAYSSFADLAGYDEDRIGRIAA